MVTENEQRFWESEIEGAFSVTMRVAPQPAFSAQEVRFSNFRAIWFMLIFALLGGLGGGALGFMLSGGEASISRRIGMIGAALGIGIGIGFGFGFGLRLSQARSRS